MSEFKTRAEIVAALETIQYQEKLRSGSLASGLGINRGIERLAENDDAIRQVLRQLSLPNPLGGGTWTLASGSLSFTSNISIGMLGETGEALNNAITTAASPIVFSVDPSVAYVVVDRATPTSIASVIVADLATFVTALTGAADRLDFYILAWYTASGVQFPDGGRLRDGYSHTTNRFIDTQYGQQTEVTQVREQQKENLNLRLTGGGDLTWDASTTTLTWSAELRISFPSSAGYNYIAGPGNVSIPVDSAWYATLSRDPAGADSIGTGVAVLLAGGVPDTDDAYVLAIHNGADNRVYLAEGTAISDAEAVKLGGVRIGVQWYYKEAGDGMQPLDLAAAGLGAQTSYRVASGELMVYRNGIKAIGSKAYWEGGVYPAGGPINTDNGVLADADDYVEEDSGDGSGTRILWRADSGGDALEHAAGTHDPPLEYPGTDDVVEAFIGVQGQSPTVTVPTGIYGFERIWADAPGIIKTHGGYLVSNGERYTAAGLTGLTLTPADMIGAETLTPSTIHYIYLGPGATVADPPDIKLSVKAPDVATVGPGVHPDFPLYRFLSSVFVRATSTFVAFEKSGGRVTLGRQVDMAAAFAGSITGSYVAVDLSGDIPKGINRVRILLSVTAQAAVTVGNRLALQYKNPDFSAPGQESWSIKPANSNLMEYVIDAVLNSSQELDFQGAGADFQNVAAAYLLDYDEGRNTSGQGLL